MADSNTLAQKYTGVKPVKFSNPFSSWQEFQTQVGMPVTAAWNGLQKVGNWIDNSKFGKWANESTPKPAQKPAPNTGARLLTNEEVKQMIAESRQGVKNLPAPESKVEPVQQAPAAPATPAQAPTKQSKGYFADNGFANLQSFAARKNWIAEAKNAEYLKRNGFDVENYRGTAQQNRDLLNLLNQQKNMYSGNPRTQPRQEPQPTEVTPEQKYINDIYASGKPLTDDELKNIAGDTDWISYARHLNNTDLDRFMSIKTGLKGPNDLSYTRRPINVGAPLTFSRVGDILNNK